MAHMSNRPTLMPVSRTNSHVFRPPPKTPSASSTFLTKSSSSLRNLNSGITSSKKRTRNDDDAGNYATPGSRRAYSPRPAGGMDSMSSSMSLDPGSPMPFVNTKYVLAGGMDTPSAAIAAQEDERGGYNDMGYRRGMSSLSSQGQRDDLDDHSMSYFPPLHGAVDTESNGRSRTASAASKQNNNDGWSRAAIGVMGGVVGKVLQFCRVGTFTGFFAGGGRGYGLEQPPQDDSEAFWEDEKEKTVFEFPDHNTTIPGHTTSIPGQFPEDGFIEDYLDHAPETPPRASKRRMMDHDSDVGKNWVIVPPDNPDQAPASPRSATAAPRYSMAASVNARHTVHGASRSPLRRTVGVSTARPSFSGSPSLLRSPKNASFGSPRSPSSSKIPLPTREGSPQKLSNSPASIEAQKWAAKKRREDREAEVSMRRFNKQLKDMIREGKQALGTKFEVEDDDDLVDEGFHDGGFEAIGKRKW